MLGQPERQRTPPAPQIEDLVPVAHSGALGLGGPRSARSRCLAPCAGQPALPASRSGTSSRRPITADPANRGKVLDTSLWRDTRQPNYLGDFLVWWGLWLIAAETGWGLLTFAGPVVMRVLLMRVSGVSLLERDISERRPGSAGYSARTSAPPPRPPRG